MVGHRLKLRFVGKRFLINGHTLKAAKWDFVKLNQQIGVKKALLQIETSLLLQSSHLDFESLTPPLITCLSNNMLRQNNQRNLEPLIFITSFVTSHNDFNVLQRKTKKYFPFFMLHQVQSSKKTGKSKVRDILIWWYVKKGTWICAKN